MISLGVSYVCVYVYMSAPLGVTIVRVSVGSDVLRPRNAVRLTLTGCLAGYILADFCFDYGDRVKRDVGG